MKKTIWIGAGLGSSLGGAIPLLWHASLFSPWAILLSTIGGIASIFAVYKLYQ